MNRKYAIGIATMFLAAILFSGNAWAEGHGNREPGGPGHGPGQQVRPAVHGGGHGSGSGPSVSNHHPHRRPQTGHQHRPCIHNQKHHHQKPKGPHYKHRPSSAYFFSAIIKQPGLSLGFAKGERR